jgi:hypothetical protein
MFQEHRNLELDGPSSVISINFPPNKGNFFIILIQQIKIFHVLPRDTEMNKA